MSHKERAMAAIRGESCDRLPFIPRLDLWYNANKIAGTLPEKYKNASLIDIVDDLDIGYHCVLPDFSDFEDIYDGADVGLGIHRTRSVFYTVEFDVDREVVFEGNETVTTYKTPYGNINTRVHYDDEMRRNGITQAVITKFAIENEKDYAPLGYIFEHSRVIPRYDYYDRMVKVVGDRGPIVAFHNEGGSPLHSLQKEMIPFDIFCYHLADCPEKMEEAAEKIGILHDKIFDVVVNSPSEIIFTGANYDSMITYPPFFKRSITPCLRKRANLLHNKGKFLLTHTDGENKGLLEEYVDSKIDVADSICPFPMTKQTLREVRDVFGNRVTIWGGIAAISMLESSMSDYEYEKYLDDVLSSIGDGRNIIFSIADTTPPATMFGRILLLKKKLEEFGPVKL